jgi:tetratricopeptide (TPR) repeat protein
MNFGVLWGARGNYKKAEYCLLKSLTIIKKYTKNPDHIYDNQYMWTLVDLGQDYEEEHKPELATPYYLEALDIFPYIRGPVAAGKKAMIFRLLGENYLHRKLYDKAKYNLTLSLGLYEEFHLTDQESTKYQNRIKEDLKKIDANVTH